MVKLCIFEFKNPNVAQSLKIFARPYGRMVVSFRNSGPVAALSWCAHCTLQCAVFRCAAHGAIRTVFAFPAVGAPPLHIGAPVHRIGICPQDMRTKLKEVRTENHNQRQYELQSGHY